jgi:3-isopropylmalate dehydrogenase
MLDSAPTSTESGSNPRLEESDSTHVVSATSRSRVDIAAMMGDGIGPDVINAAMRVLREATQRRGIELNFDILPAGLSALPGTGSTLPSETIERLSSYAGWILGPVSTHLYPAGDTRYLSPSGHLRKRFELYANIRPAKSFQGVDALVPEVDFVIVRENTEGFYADRNLLDGNGELRPDENTVISVRVVTRRASLRVARQAFELARVRRRKVTVVHKANVLKRGDGLFLECCREVGREYPDVVIDDYHVDAFAMHMLSKYRSFDVVVTTNMFGDILSEEAAGLVGGLGLSPSLNLGDDHAMAQAVHGSAPELAGLGIANPIAAILSGKLLLDWLSRREHSPELHAAATDIEVAVVSALADGRYHTPDLQGSATTNDLTTAIAERLGR